MKRPKWDPEEIRRLYWDEGMSTPAIAKAIGSGGGAPAIVRFMQRHSIPRRSMSDGVSLSWQGADERRQAASQWLSALRHSDSVLTATSALAAVYRRKLTAGEALVAECLEALEEPFIAQQELGPFIADFVLEHRKLIIEVDTGHHSIPHIKARDAERDVYFDSHGYRIIRLKLGPHLDKPSLIDILRIGLRPDK
jgi:very-short-patch-repair endonuclease